jgi:hypothetical protein
MRRTSAAEQLLFATHYSTSVSKLNTYTAEKEADHMRNGYIAIKVIRKSHS